MVAVAMPPQSPFCIEDHSKRTVKASVLEADVAEAVIVAAALRAGAVLPTSGK